MIMIQKEMIFNFRLEGLQVHGQKEIMDVVVDPMDCRGHQGTARIHGQQSEVIMQQRFMQLKLEELMILREPLTQWI